MICTPKKQVHSEEHISPALRQPQEFLQHFFQSFKPPPIVKGSTRGEATVLVLSHHVLCHRARIRMDAGRAMHEGDLLPAKVKSHGNRAYVAYAGKEWVKYEFEILASHHIAWQFSRDGQVNPQAMVIGHTKEGEKLYMGRAFYDGTITLGKIHPSHKCLYIPYNGQEIAINEYEIMLLI